ncbi:MAG: YihY/virulence factor BrkB family protein [Longimicrobiales bacterium]
MTASSQPGHAPAAAPSGGGGKSSPTPRSRFTRWRNTAGDFLRRVYKKADQDKIFFMAGAIAFNILVATVPLILAALGVAGVILQSRYGVGAEEPLVRYILEALPPVSPEFNAEVRAFMRGLLEQSSGFIGIGTVIFAWLATRLIGTLRTALREIFDIQQDRGIIAGKLFDIKMVIAAGTLLAINASLTVMLNIVAQFGYNVLGIGPNQIQILNQLYLRAGALLSIWFMFLLIYRYLPARRIQWRTALVAATFTALFVELLKQAFAWYVTTFADYRSAYSNLANLFVLILWVYYSAVIFIIGGEVGQVTALRRIRRRQKERLG